MSEVAWLWYFRLQLLLAAIALAGASYTLVTLLINFRSMRKLLSLPIAPVEQCPAISIVAPARNEERNIEQALRSLLAIDYPRLQLTIVNDRSTDRTAEILACIAKAEPRLNVVDVTELPAGWLGKNYAMQLGARGSGGAWLLFTDADIVFEPTTLRRAIGYAQQQQLDHLAAYPDVRMGHWLLDAFVVTFAMMFTMFVRPHQVRNPRRKAYIGIGAFNLVRADAYRAIGGHEPIRMRPDDDLKLGHLLKKNGFRSDVVNGLGCVQVEWYSSIKELLRGLEKNCAAPLEYNTAVILLSCALLFIVHVWPFMAVLITWRWPQTMFAAAAMILLLCAARTAREVGQPLRTALLYPVAISLFLYIQLRSLVLLLYRGGIYWRDTFYPLRELRANRL